MTFVSGGAGETVAGAGRVQAATEMAKNKIQMNSLRIFMSPSSFKGYCDWPIEHFINQDAGQPITQQVCFSRSFNPWLEKDSIILHMTGRLCT
jgi:hypothetical protein